MRVVFEGRARDLVSTAERQLTAKAYDAAIDTYRTALGELPSDTSSDARAQLESLMAKASQMRDRARGPEALLCEARAHRTAGRATEASEVAQRVLAIDPANAEAAQLCNLSPASVTATENSARDLAVEASEADASSPQSRLGAELLTPEASEGKGSAPLHSRLGADLRLPESTEAEVPAPLQSRLGAELLPIEASEGKASAPLQSRLGAELLPIEASETEVPAPLESQLGAELLPPASPQVDLATQSARPAPPQVPIEPPSFHLLEDDPSMLERPDREEYIEEPPLSILDPTPRPQQSDYSSGFAIAGVIALIVIMSIFTDARHRAARFSPPVAVRGQSDTFSVTDGVVAPVVLSRVEPEYTEEARAAGRQGTVVVYVAVEPDGTPTVLGVLRGVDRELNERATQAVSQWRFQPGTKDGRPVRVLIKVDVDFRLP